MGSNPVAANGLDAWLIERYRAFVPRSNQPLLTATVEHPPWETSPADLIYYNEAYRAFVLVQYKAMEKAEDGAEFRWQDGGQFTREMSPG